MKRLIIFVPLALIACSAKPGTGAAEKSPTDIEARLAAAMKLQPGNWATKFEIVRMEAAGTSDPKAADAINQAMAAHGGRCQCVRKLYFTGASRKADVDPAGRQ